MKVHKWSEEQVKSAKKPNYSKLYVIAPALMNLIGDVKNKKILEIGCGDGYWLRILNKKGARCTGFDISKKQIKSAESENKEKEIKYFVADGSEEINLENNSFDVILLEHVILEISELSKIKKIFKQTQKLLKENGFLIVGDIHPFAPETNFPNVEVEKEYNYFKSGFPFKIVSKKPDGSVTRYTDFHWTVQDLINSITETGLKITKILEPTPNKKTVEKYPYLKYRENKPLAIMIKAQK
ncbi:class I SAM-dependent methyltransferase [archaeon]|jgi:2-polyprenyl-3-methyl-5-hydroxy-6-metoxy-1,4-benzoquinol methylase|nr:class I SAM-dependent methyltransferase [archaeon]MBT6762224.1 class I SAM-dependent methyltransferase [archaeon]